MGVLQSVLSGLWGFHRYGKLLSISDVSLWMVERAEKSFDCCSIYIILCHVAYLCMYVCVCFFVFFVFVLFPDVFFMFWWVMSFILHTSTSHI